MKVNIIVFIVVTIVIIFTTNINLIIVTIIIHHTEINNVINSLKVIFKQSLKHELSLPNAKFAESFACIPVLESASSMAGF